MSPTRAGVLLCAVAITGCLPRARTAPPLPPLVAEGELLLYFEPLPEEPVRLEFTITSAAAVARDGRAHPLAVTTARVGATPSPHQRLLARGRLPPGEYAGVLLAIGRASIARDAGTADLLVGSEPSRLEVPFAIGAGRATVLGAELQPGRWLEDRHRFVPALTVAAPQKPVPGLVGYCSNTSTNDLTVFDRIRRRVLAVVAVGRAPQGIAIDATSSRAYVAVSEDGAVEVLDVAAERLIGRVRLDLGDVPRDVALTPDGRLLVIANSGSNSVSFADPTSWMELGRVTVGDGPTAVLIDRSGQRAYVLNRGSASITVLDLAYRAVVSTLSLGAEPLDAALDRDGALLYVTERGSQYLAVHALPDLAPRRRIFVGLGATGVAVDPRTNRIYVSSDGQSRIDVLDAAASMPVGAIELPGAASELTILPAEHLLLAVMPAERAVAVVELPSGKVVSVFDVGGAPYELAAPGAAR